MSRTLRKYPVSRSLANGIFYDNWEDIPKKTVRRTFYRRETERKLVRAYKYGIDRHGRECSTIEMVWQESETGKFVKCQHDYETYIDHTDKYYYNKKSPEGWNHCNRVWHSHGVGKVNKRIRKKQLRSRARDVIKHWEKDDFSCDIERERNRDRWDWLQKQSLCKSETL